MRKLWETGNWVWNKTVKAAFKQIIIITDYFDEFLKAIVFKTFIVFSWKKKWKVAVNYKSSTIYIVPDDKQQLQGSPELSKKLWMDFSQDGKRQTVTEMKKSDILYNEELKKIPVMYLSNNIINVFFVHLTCLYIYISFLFSTLHMYFVFNQL